MTTSTPPPLRPQPRRSRARTFAPLAVAAYAVLEIWLLTVVAGATSGGTVLLLLVAGFVLGALVVKRAGRSAWRSLTGSMQPGTPGVPGVAAPGSEATGAALGMLGGLLLMLPGFVSDAVGLLCLFPPTRVLLRKVADRALARRGTYDSGSIGDLFQQARVANEQIRIHRPDGKVIPGEVIQGEVVDPDRKNPGAER
ncbi:FxsA family membrane protein [Streptomyces sp. H10-C2]|uniref:FxsA family membrane protein n=1 Tax=unclassified Streptomyces TaxID=2593676 RepID=UPI0024BA9E54|nr:MULTISPECIES: FxsA family membrane protein [unclassified Streptomyces]MDJ0345577.1 FxsA family membrane protein [Streptomyces sp. PH10-H1]MDJ0371410.1 FxsA family membrane protein [Streptomyces sp. H10-C2]